MKTLKIILLVGLIFVAGFAAGVVTTRAVVRHFVRRAIENPDLVRDRIARELARDLRLDAEQRVKVDKILGDAQARIKVLRVQVQPEFAGIVRDAATNINAVLTPEQQARFDKFRAQHEVVFKVR